MIHDPLPWSLVEDDRHPHTEQLGAEPDLIEEANRTAGICVLGLVVGSVIVTIVDAAIGGPGLLSGFGL